MPRVPLSYSLMMASKPVFCVGFGSSGECLEQAAAAVAKLLF